MADPVAYVINMDKSRERMEFMQRQLDGHGIRFQRFPAIDGSLVSPADRMTKLTPKCRRTCTDSMVGAAMSHLAVWKQVIEDGHASALVMEDDAKLCDNFTVRLAEALDAVPNDFDILVLGCFMFCDVNRKYPLGIRVMKAFAPSKRLRQDRRTFTSGSTTVFVPELFAGLHCYVVSAKGARRMLDLMKRVDFHVDAELNLLPIHLYAASPDLAFQRDMTMSTIASYDFPKLLLPLLSSKDRKGIPIAYYMNSPVGEVAGLRINMWALIFLVMGLSLPHRAWPYVATYIAADVAASGVVRGALLPGMAYTLGVCIRRYIKIK